MKTIGEKAKEFRLSKGWNTTQMAKHVGTSRQNIENLEEKGDMVPRYVGKLAKALGVTVDSLIGGRITANLTLPMITLASSGGPAESANVVPGPSIRGSVPLLSNVQAGMYREVLDLHPGEESVQQIPTTVPVNRYTFALRVQGDSMEPKFTAGMLLIVEPELDAQNNDYVIVKNGSDETTFKQLIKDGEEWLLKPLNNRYPIKPLGQNTIVGVVRGVTEQFR